MKILVATDGSKYGRWATEWVTQIPFASPPQVTALHVVDAASLRAPFVVQPTVVGNERFIQAEIKRLEAHGRKVVAGTRSLLSSLGLKGKVVAERGTIASSILKRAPKRDGLIVVGSRGLDALDRFMLGSVSTQVTLHALCSVLVVKQQPRPIRRVLLATDGSKASERALQFLIREMRPRAGEDRNVGEVLVMHVLPSFAHPYTTELGKIMVQHYAQKLSRAGYRVREASPRGRAAEEIIKAAKKNGMDLIVTGAKGLNAVARFFLGSVSTKVVQQSSCSVLVVR